MSEHGTEAGAHSGRPSSQIIQLQANALSPVQDVSKAMMPIRACWTWGTQIQHVAYAVTGVDAILGEDGTAWMFPATLRDEQGTSMHIPDLAELAWTCGPAEAGAAGSGSAPNALAAAGAKAPCRSTRERSKADGPLEQADAHAQAQAKRGGASSSAHACDASALRAAKSASRKRAGSSAAQASKRQAGTELPAGSRGGYADTGVPPVAGASVPAHAAGAAAAGASNTVVDLADSDIDAHDHGASGSGGNAAIDCNAVANRHKIGTTCAAHGQGARMKSEAINEEAAQVYAMTLPWLQGYQAWITGEMELCKGAAALKHITKYQSDLKDAP